MKVYFVGAGPGDLELLTIKGKKIIENADVVIYAGSLVTHEIREIIKSEAKIHDSSKMNLEEVCDLYLTAKKINLIVARVHTGDPCLFGAIGEQIEFCKDNDILYEVIPGVSSFLAGAAALSQELTLPDITQTVIISRIAGRTSVPEKEELKKLAQIKATLVLFLSVNQIEKITNELKNAGYLEDTPVRVVYKASWSDQKIISGNIKNIASQVKKENIKKHALIYIGEVLNNKNYSKSKLYDKNFSHEYRNQK